MKPLLEKPTVLVVDDDRGPRESLRMILEPAHRVLLAANGFEAIEILRTNFVDVVSLDLNMPGIKGTELMATLRSEFPQVEVVVITGYGTVETATLAVRYGVSDYLQKPFDVVQVTAAVGRALERRRAQRQLTAFLEALGSVLGRERDVRALLAEVARSPRLRGSVGEVMEHAGREARAHEGESARTTAFLEVLAETIESQDPYMRGHARRVAFYAGLLAERVGLSTKEQEQVRISAFLHDLGKIGVATELLRRPSGLEPAERVLVERHAEIGARLVEPLGIANAIAGAIRHHHEWWDGSGYPDGLHGDEIPLAARIVHLANAFDAMTCDRPYRRALPRDVVQRELQRFAGVQFDPALTKEFLALVESGACDVDLEVVAEAVAGVGGWKESAGSSAQS
jgi:putative nucleotidyltransferase with HDIG domain